MKSIKPNTWSLHDVMLRELSRRFVQMQEEEEGSKKDENNNLRMETIIRLITCITLHPLLQ